MIGKELKQKTFHNLDFNGHYRDYGLDIISLMKIFLRMSKFVIYFSLMDLSMQLKRMKELSYVKNENWTSFI